MSLRDAIVQLAEGLEGGIVQTDVGPIHTRQSKSIAREVRALLDDHEPEDAAREAHPATMIGRK